jgi:hypothetical protein
VAPAVPVTVIVEAAIGVEAVVVIVAVVVQVGLQEAGAKEAEAPVGSPEALNDTAVVAPEDRVAVMELVMDEPCLTLLGPPLDRVKSKTGA